jgi:secretion/DNA translocation related CpaE-like protein
MAAATRVLLVTASDELAASAMRAAALVGVDVELQRADQAVRGGWREASTVVLGLDVLESIARLALPNRPGLLLVAVAEPTADQWRAALALGIADVLQLPFEEARLGELISALGRDIGPQGRVLAVTGSCGGAGASTLAAAIALVAGSELTVMLVDADPLGGGIDVLLGAETRHGLRWADVIRLPAPLDATALADRLCLVAGVAVLAHGRGEPVVVAAATTRALLESARQKFGLVVVDLPRHRDEAAEVVLEVAEQLVVVVPATVRAVAAAAVLARGLGRRRGDTHIVVRDPGGERLQARDVEAGLGLPVVATIRSDAAVAAAAIRGEPPSRRRGALVETRRAVLALLDACDVA